MRVNGSLDLALTNLTSPPVLAFVLGLIAVLVRSDVRLPDAVYQAISMYLLLAIGIKGGVALREADLAQLPGPLIATLALGTAIPTAAFLLLRGLTPLGAIDRGAIAAHYGSTSLVTFTAAIVFLDAAGESYEGFMATLLTVMEVPGIVVGLMLAGATSRGGVTFGAALREVLAGRSIVLLTGGLALGALTGSIGYERVEPFFGDLFTGILTLFLLELGFLTGRRLKDIRLAGPGLVLFAVAFPFLAGTAGIALGTLAGLSTGGAMVLGVLSASASYIAAPAAVRLSLPQANPAYSLTASLGLTFPVNLVIGIPTYLWLARAVSDMIG